MKTVYIFGKNDCSVCKDAIEKINYFKLKKDFSAEVKYFDMESVDGLAEGSYYEIADIPTIIILDNDRELVRWVKKPPVSKEFLPFLV